MSEQAPSAPPARVPRDTDEDHDAWAVVHTGKRRVIRHAALPVAPFLIWDETAHNGTISDHHEALGSSDEAVSRFFARIDEWLHEGATLVPPPLRFHRPGAVREELVALHIPVDRRFEWTAFDASGARTHHAEDSRAWGDAIVAFNRKASALREDGYALQPGRFEPAPRGIVPFDRRLRPNGFGGVVQERHAADREAPSRREFDADGGLIECATTWRSQSHGITAQLRDGRITGLRRFEAGRLRALRLMKDDVVVAQSDAGHDAQERRTGTWIVREIDTGFEIRETHREGRLTRAVFAPLTGGALPPREKLSGDANPASCALAFASDERLVIAPLPRGRVARRATLEPGASALTVVAQRQDAHDSALMIFVRELLWGLHEQSEGRLRLLSPERVFTRVTERATELFTIFMPATAILAWRTGTLGDPDVPNARRMGSLDDALREADALIERYTREGFTERTAPPLRPRGAAQSLVGVVRVTGPDGARIELAFEHGALTRMRSLAPNGRPVLFGWRLEPDRVDVPARFAAEALTEKLLRTYCVFALRTPFQGPFPEFVRDAAQPPRPTSAFPSESAPLPTVTHNDILSLASAEPSRGAFVAVCRRFEDLARVDRGGAAAAVPALVAALARWPSRVRAAPFDWVDLFLDGTLPDDALALVRALCVSPAIGAGQSSRLLAWWSALPPALPPLEGLSLGRDAQHCEGFFEVLQQRPGAAERVARMQRPTALEETARALLAAPIARALRVFVAPLPEIQWDIFSNSDQDSFLDRDLGLDALTSGAPATTLEAVDLFGHSGAMEATQRELPRLTALRAGGGQWAISGAFVRRLGAAFPRLRTLDLRGSHADVAPTLAELDDETSSRLTRYWWLPGTIPELRSMRITPDALASLVAACVDLAWLRLPAPALDDGALREAFDALADRGMNVRSDGLDEPLWTRFFDL